MLSIPYNFSQIDVMCIHKEIINNYTIHIYFLMIFLLFIELFSIISMTTFNAYHAE